MAVVIPTVLRSDLERAVHSVFSQDVNDRIQILIGIDKQIGERSLLDKLQRNRPAHCAITILDLGYSTSKYNGGLYSAGDGGAIRTMLSFAANSRYVAYLDDDNWWDEGHLSSLRAAIEGHAWAHSLRWLVEENSLRRLAIDEWHSVGVNRGDFRETLGGMCDPSTLMIDKLNCAPGLHLWCSAWEGRSGADKRFFRFLKEKPGAQTNLATLNYVIRNTNVMWRHLNALGIRPSQ